MNSEKQTLDSVHWKQWVGRYTAWGRGWPEKRGNECSEEAQLIQGFHQLSRRSGAQNKNHLGETN